MKAVPVGTVEKPLFVPIMDARLLGMPVQTGSKSIVVAGADNWG